MKQKQLNKLYYAGRQYAKAELKRGTPAEIVRQCLVKEKTRLDEYFNRGILKQLSE